MMSNTKLQLYLVLQIDILDKDMVKISETYLFFPKKFTPFNWASTCKNFLQKWLGYLGMNVAHIPAFSQR